MATVLGVDFSGAADPGDDIWLTHVVEDGGEVTVQWCRSARAELGSTAREDVLVALADRIASDYDRAGLDVPFGLPEPLVDAESWTDFVEAFPERYDSPDTFRTACLRAAGGEVKRWTYQKHGGQCPCGLRIRYQTFYGIRDLLGRLVAEFDAAVPPMKPEGTGPTVLEVYPAGTLDATDGADRRGYKGGARETVETRRTNLDAIEAEIGSVDADVRDYTIATDDALDSLVAAWAAAENGDPDYPEPDECPVEREGFIHV